MSAVVRQPTFQGHYAGFVSRAMAFVFDIVVVTGVIAIGAAVTESILGFFGLGAIMAHPQVNSTLHDLLLIIGITVTALWNAAYFVAFWVLIGQTPGQALFGLRVVRLDRRPMTVWRALLRYLGYWLALIPLGLGFLWVLVDRRRQGWNDKLARTVVIYAWDTRYADDSWGAKVSARIPTGHA